MTVPPARSLEQRIAKAYTSLGAAERRVADTFATRRETVLGASAAKLAALAGTSDATVIRTARALGYRGLADLRRDLEVEVGAALSPANRLAGTLRAVGDSVDSALHLTLAGHLEAVTALQATIASPATRAVVEAIAKAERVVIFGLGPSSALATYVSLQLRRFGFASATLTNSGLLFADDVHSLRKGDFVLMLAYTRPYREFAVLVAAIARRRLRSALITDGDGPLRQSQVDHVLLVERGKSGMVSMHAATFALLEAMLVAVASRRRSTAMRALKDLNSLRSAIAGPALMLTDTPRRRPRR